MRRAVQPAMDAAGAVLDAIPSGISDRRLRDFDGELQIAARAAAVPPVAATVWSELVTSEEQREADLGHLEAAELDAAGRLPLARTRPAVASGRSAAAGTGLEQVPDERLPHTRVDALDGDAEAAAPAGHCPVRAGRRQRLDDRLNDLLAAAVGGQRHRLAGPRVHDRALARDHAHRAEGAVVLGRLGIDQVGQAPPPPPSAYWGRRS